MEAWRWKAIHPWNTIHDAIMIFTLKFWYGQALSCVSARINLLFIFFLGMHSHKIYLLCLLCQGRYALPKLGNNPWKKEIHGIWEAGYPTQREGTGIPRMSTTPQGQSTTSQNWMWWAKGARTGVSEKHMEIRVSDRFNPVQE